MKSKIPSRLLGRELAEPNPCDVLKDRRCLRADGQPKRWYLRHSAAKAIVKKYQCVYACPSGTGFHIGS